MSPVELAATLPPLTDAQVARVAELLALGLGRADSRCEA